MKFKLKPIPKVSKLEALLNSQMGAIYQKALTDVSLLNFVRGMLNTKFNSSGLKDSTGNLRACINKSTIHLSKQGLRISPGGGFTKDVYIRLNVFTFGGVIGSGVKSQKIKKTIKRTRPDIKGVHIIEGRSLYQLDSSEKEAVLSRFNALVELEMNNRLR